MDLGHKRSWKSAQNYYGTWKFIVGRGSREDTTIVADGKLMKLHDELSLAVRVHWLCNLQSIKCNLYYLNTFLCRAILH